MRTLSILFAGLAAVLAFGLPAHAQDKPTASVVPPAAVGGAQSLIYFVPGVYDNGGADNTGRATTFFLYQCEHGRGNPAGRGAKRGWYYCQRSIVQSRLRSDLYAVHPFHRSFWRRCKSCHWRRQWRICVHLFDHATHVLLGDDRRCLLGKCARDSASLGQVLSAGRHAGIVPSALAR
jgi:hypothetical protein